MLKRKSASQRPLVLVTDPGPDPDDIKALLLAAVLHRQGRITLKAVIANGGQQPELRARLAQCVLDHVGIAEVPVGIGTQGVPYAAQAHEYDLAGFTRVDPARLRDGAALLLATLDEAAAKSLTVVLISSMRDVSDVLESHAQLFIDKVASVSIMGGLEPDAAARFGWAPDSSVNNGFDKDAAAAVYAFCFAHGVPMTVVSRHAVPMLPMQLARSFAERTECEVLRYLASAQFLGLEGLWQKLCEGKLPARCDKRWFFETFCGVDADAFDERHERLGRDADIASQLCGYVKPYDVIALMTALPSTSELFSIRCDVHEVAGVSHRLLLQPEHCVDGEHVARILRECYHEVVLHADEAARSRRPPAEHASTLRRRAKAPSVDSVVGGGGGAPNWPAHGDAAGSASAEPARGSDDGGSFSARRLRSSLPLSFDPAGSWAPLPTTGAPAAAPAGPSSAPDRLARSSSTPSDESDGWSSSRGSFVGGLPKPKLKLRSSKCPLLLPYDPTAPRAGRALDSLRNVRKTFSVDFDRLLKANILNRLQKALDEVREEHAGTVGTVRAVVTATSVGALALLAQDAREHARLVGGGGGGGGGGLGASSARSHGYLRHALCVLLLLGALPALVLTTQTRAAHLRAYRALTAAVFALLAAGAATSGARAARAPAVDEWLRAHAAAAGCGAGGAAGAAGAGGAQLLLSLTLAADCGGALHAGCAAALGAAALALGAFAGRHWGSAPRLLDGAWAGVGVAALAYGLTALACHAARRAAPPPAGCALDGDGTAEGAAWLLGLGCVGAGCAFAWPSSRRRAQAAFARATGSLGTYAPLAPLLGYGCARHGGELEPEQVYADSMASFRVAALDERARRRLALQILPRAAHEPRRRAAAAAAADESEWARLRARADGGAPLHAAPCADFYIVHSWDDDATQKVGALRAWAERCEAELGRPVTVWMDALCPDAARAPHAALQRMPVFLAKCSKLLLLCGPTLVDRLWCATELFCWRATGGKQLDVEVVLVAPPGESAALERIVASFDAFHVMYCAAQREDERTRMEYAVELATVSRFNDRVRWFYPIVQEAVRAHRARARGAEPGGGPPLRLPRSFTLPDEHSAGADAARPRLSAHELVARARRASTDNDEPSAGQRRAALALAAGGGQHVHEPTVLE